MSDTPKRTPIAARFRGYLPVVVDVETAGLNPQTDALLEVAAVILEMDEQGYLRPGPTYAAHVPGETRSRTGNRQEATEATS